MVSSANQLIFSVFTFLALSLTWAEPLDPHVAASSRYPPPPHHPPHPPRRTHSPACCLPYFPVNDYGRPLPILDQLLFEQCPLEKTPEAVCKAAANHLVSPPSILQVSVHKTVKAEGLRFLYNKAKSPASADIGIVGNGCCFNIYPGVKVDQPLSSACLNPKLGSNQSLLKSVFKSSVMAAGDTDVYGTFSRSIVQGGDFLSTFPAETKIANQYYGGLIEDAGFVLAGGVPVDGGSIKVVNGDFYYGRDEQFNSRVDSLVKNRLQDPIKTARQISVQVCAVSQNMAELEKNSHSIFSNDSERRRLSASEVSDEGADMHQLRRLQGEEAVTCDPATGGTCGDETAGLAEVTPRLLAPIEPATTILFQCSSQYNPCVFEITAGDLNNAIGITFSASADKTLIINVKGKYVNTSVLNDASSPTIEESTNVIVWNFFEADNISLLFDNVAGSKWPGSVLAPRAKIVEISGQGMVGTVATGNRWSVVTAYNSGEPPSFDSLSALPRSPPPNVDVVYCHCLCPESYKPRNPHSRPSHPAPPSYPNPHHR